MDSALQSSARMDWCSPANVLELVRQFSPIDLDPCSNAESIVGARVSWTEADDGLARQWTGRGLAYVNPPYGRALREWAAKVRDFAEHRRPTDELILLVPARIDTSWWRTAVHLADAVCFIHGRLTFLGAPHPAPFPSALIYTGGRRDRFCRVFRGLGWCVDCHREVEGGRMVCAACGKASKRAVVQLGLLDGERRLCRACHRAEERAAGARTAAEASQRAEHARELRRIEEGGL